MHVSHFELVYKPQSPVGPADTAIQGYFLKITNLEDRALRYGLEFTTSSISNPDRSLFGNAVIFVDTPSVNNSGVFSLVGPLDAKSFTLNRLITVPAHGTALVAMLPSDPFPPQSIAPADADFECRGYVTITLPALRFRQQSKVPVKVMLTAQNRTVYVDQASGVAKGQSQASVPIATGQALNELEPLKPDLSIFEGGGLAVGGGLVANVDLFPLKEELELLGQPPIEVLFSLLSDLSESEMKLADVNKALKEAGIGMAVETRRLT